MGIINKQYRQKVKIHLWKLYSTMRKALHVLSSWITLCCIHVPGLNSKQQLELLRFNQSLWKYSHSLLFISLIKGCMKDWCWQRGVGVELQYSALLQAWEHWLVCPVDIKNAFAPHPTRRLNKEHLSNGSGQVSFLWVCKLVLSVSNVQLLHWIWSEWDFSGLHLSGNLKGLDFLTHFHW